MSQIQVKATAIVNATPAQVYAVFADYRNHHPNILPKAYFTELLVEQGGQGAGTVFRAKLRVFGQESAYHMVVSEPIPGRTLVETDMDTGLATSFTALPTAQPEQTQVEIATSWAAKPGIAGLLERLMTPPVMRMIYRQELAQLATYLQQTRVQTH